MSGPTRRDLSGYRGMWLFAMFDLPVKTRLERRIYGRFRKLLISQGFSRLQFSVYARYFACEEASRSCRHLIRGNLPPRGSVRLLGVTDRQFGKMKNYIGKKREKTEQPPDQLLLL